MIQYRLNDSAMISCRLAFSMLDSCFRDVLVLVSYMEAHEIIVTRLVLSATTKNECRLNITINIPCTTAEDCCCLPDPLQIWNIFGSPSCCLLVARWVTWTRQHHILRKPARKPYNCAWVSVLWWRCASVCCKVYYLAVFWLWSFLYCSRPSHSESCSWLAYLSSSPLLVSQHGFSTLFFWERTNDTYCFLWQTCLNLFKTHTPPPNNSFFLFSRKHINVYSELFQANVSFYLLSIPTLSSCLLQTNHRIVYCFLDQKKKTLFFVVDQYSTIEMFGKLVDGELAW